MISQIPSSVQFGANNTFRFNLPAFDALPEGLQAQGPQAAAKTLKLHVFNEALHQLKTFDYRDPRCLPEKMMINWKRTTPEDVVVLTNDRAREGDVAPGNDVNRFKRESEALGTLRPGAPIAERNAWHEKFSSLLAQYRENATPADINVSNVLMSETGKLRVAFDIPELDYESLNVR